MLRLTSLAAVLALALPASASAFTGAAAGPAQRLEIDRSAAKTQPCGYNGNASKLHNFRVVNYVFGDGKAQFASVIWIPLANSDACDLIFVRKPGYTLRSTQTDEHPFVDWVPVTWGSSPFDSPSYLTGVWRHWFKAQPPNWLHLAQALVRY